MPSPLAHFHQTNVRPKIPRRVQRNHRRDEFRQRHQTKDLKSCWSVQEPSAASDWSCGRQASRCRTTTPACASLLTYLASTGCSRNSANNRSRRRRRRRLRRLHHLRHRRHPKWLVQTRRPWNRFSSSLFIVSFTKQFFSCNKLLFNQWYCLAWGKLCGIRNIYVEGFKTLIRLFF